MIAPARVALLDRRGRRSRYVVAAVMELEDEVQLRFLVNLRRPN